MGMHGPVPTVRSSSNCWRWLGPITPSLARASGRACWLEPLTWIRPTATSFAASVSPNLRALNSAVFGSEYT